MKEFFALFLLVVSFNCTETDSSGKDYAPVSMKDKWLHHPVLGDPSFDTFERYLKNPVQRGDSTLEWPVNGFYFSDPLSGNEYIYAGQYRRNYAISREDPALNITSGCIIFRSSDEGKTWEKRGSVFKDKNVVPEGEDQPIIFAPDVSVVYHDGKYYLACDYLTAGFSWSGDKLRHSGLAVAVSDSPEGPFTILRKPAVPTSYFFDNPVFGKYNRCYACTLLKTGDQWVILFMLDSGSHFSWALAAVSAPAPEGPWSEPVVLKSVEDSGYYPSLMEYFPAFQHNDTIYAPTTSVGLNRNFQAIFSVPSGKVMTPGQWKIRSEGSLWHSENLENEHAGIWGQTFSGFVSQSGMFKVMFPSQDPQKMGTINIASTKWNQLYRDTGFVFTGQYGPSYSSIPDLYKQPVVEAAFSYYGTVALAINNLAPCGPDLPKADATLHPLMFTDQTRFGLSENQWWVVHISSGGKADTLGHGSYSKKENTSLKISYQGKETLFTLDGSKVWNGELNNQQSGRVGLYAMSHSGMEVKKFAVSGENEHGNSAWLFTEGLLNAGNDLKHWTILKENPLFTYGTGAISKIENARVKWSFKGTGFDLFLPKMPEAGIVRIILNGKILREMDLHADTPEKSRIVYSARNLTQNSNALIVEGVKGKLVVDCLRVYD